MAVAEPIDSMQLTGGWQLAVSQPGAFENAGAASELPDWIDAEVPGTVAGALAKAGLFDPGAPQPLHDKDIWYKRHIEVAPGRYGLKLNGLATVAEIYLNGRLVLETRNMFRSYEVPLDLTSQDEIAICFRALEPFLAQRGPRARWKPQLANSQGLRLVRTTLLGRMPGWCPEIHAAGPYRPIELIRDGTPRLVAERISAALKPDGTGSLEITVKLENVSGKAVLVCAGQRADLVQDTESGLFRAQLTLSSVSPWMPHTHGNPSLYEAAIEAGERTISLGKVGFRTIEADRGGDGKGFGLKINGTPVFCRGAIWTNADLLNLKSDASTYQPLLEAARDAGMNMLRIGGTMVYESRAFFELCDELGILVWQDFQFANYDYPVKDEVFVEEVRAEVRNQLVKLQGCPSLAVLCGGSEIYQQGAMMGLPESRWKGDLCETVLPETASMFRPDVPYVANSPCDGVLPFSPNEGVAHYYGVGAYLRPLEDARRANVRFAGECLAFSNIPEQKTLDASLPVAPGHDPEWKAGIPRDRGAGWDFEDVRDHYLKTLYGIDPMPLRYGDPGRYLDLGRLVTADIMEQTFAEWRRAGSSCQGALVWTFQDLAPGAGWGVIDALGQPKPAYYALKRAFRPLQVSVTDEGTNGLAVHVINETPQTRHVTVTLECLRDGRTKVVSGQADLELASYSTRSMNAIDLIGVFFDVTYAYRFGPPSHDATVVRLYDAETGQLLSDATHFPVGFDPARYDFEIDSAIAEQANGTYQMTLVSSRMARGVQLDVDEYAPSENWFSLAPGVPKTIALKPQKPESGVPVGLIRAINRSNTSKIG
jgi:beta-mannosidase